MLESVTIWAAIAFGGPGPISWDLGGHVVVNAPVLAITEALPFAQTRSGLAFPHVAFVDPSSAYDRRYMVQHEATHLRQHDAIGPGVNLALLLGNGQAFEDYDDIDGYMWDPGPQERNCPLLQSRDGKLRFMPCYNPF